MDVRSVLAEVYASGLKRLSELFDMCINTCAKTEKYWECVDMCHRHFNIAMAYSVEVRP